MDSERLEAEVHLAEDPESFAEQVQASNDEEVGASRLSPQVQEMIQRMLDGKEAYGRDLKPYEPMKFTPTHINICTLKAAGFKGNEISQMVGVEPARVSVILRHPYGMKLLAHLVPKNSARVLDIRTKMVEYADDLLDETFKAAMKEQDLDKLSKVTFGLLDRTGYGPKTPVAGENTRGTGLENATLLGRIAAAIDESSQVTKQIMPGYVQRRPPEEGVLPGSEVVGSSDQLAPVGRDVSETSPSELGSQVSTPLRRRA
jgi:hypothetical protein